MLPTTTLLKLAACFATFGQVVLADPEAVIAHHIVIRQDKDEDTKTTDAPKETGNANKDDDENTSSEDADNSSSGSGAKKTGADLNTAEPTKTGSDKDDKKDTKSSSAPKKTKFPADAPAGGVEMISPSAIGGSTELYKISDTVTWSWNYTSLSAAPTAVDVLVSASTAQATWTLTANMSFESSVEFVWDTEKEANDAEQPLLTDLYTLIIMDSSKDIKDTPEPGYLGVTSNFIFGLYAKQPYVDLDKWTCTGCNAGAGGFDNQAVSMAVITSVITVLSFTWFVTGMALP